MVIKFSQDLTKYFDKTAASKKLLASPLVLVGALLLALFLGDRTISLFLRERGLGREITAIEERIAKIAGENKKIEADFVKTHSPQLIEKIAKEQLNLRKAGEEVAIIVEDQAATTTTPFSRQSWLDKFFSLFMFFNW